MTTECPQCKSPVAREGQRFCYQCGNELPLESRSPVPGGGPDKTEPDTRAVTKHYKDAEENVPQAVAQGADSFETTLETLLPEMKTEQKATLRILLPTGDVFDRELARIETQIGKGPRNDIVLADPAVSTSHALIRADGGTFTISDLGSRNGTYINSERIAEPRRLNHGDVIGLGLSRLTFRLSNFSDTGAIQATDLLSSGNKLSPPPLTESSLANACLTEGLVKKADIDRLQGADAGGRRLYRALIDERLVGEETLRDLMSRIFQIQVIDLKATQVDEAVASKFPPRLAHSHQVFPVAQKPGLLTLAVADPTDTAAIDEVKREMHAAIEIRLATASDIARQIDLYYGPKLIGVLPSGEKLEYLINQQEIEIGKATHNHIVLTDPTVSNTHAVVLVRNGGYSIVDLGSRNGTFVNGERLGTHSHTLRHGDSIQLGQTVLTFRNPNESNENVTATLSSETLEEVRRRAGAVGAAGAGQASPAENRNADDLRQPQVNAARGIIVPLPADVRPGAVPPPEAITPLNATPGVIAAAEGAGEEAKGEKKKKKKKMKDDRLKAAYISGLSRIVAQVMGVVLAVLLALYVNSSMRSGSDNPVIEMTPKGKAKLKAGAIAGTAFEGGTFEASGVAQVPDGGGVLFIDDSKTGEVLWMKLDQSGKQLGPAKPIPLGVNVLDPEGITYGGGYFYVVGSQSDPKGGERDALARFIFDKNSETIQGRAEIIPNLRSYLFANVAELKGQDELKGEDGGLNIEGIAWDPVHERIMLGLRSPLVNGNALIVQLKMKDPRGAFSADNLQVAETPSIQLPLGGLGIRDIQYNTVLKSFLIISGAPEHHEKRDFILWEWDPSASGAAATTPRQEATLDSKMKPEGVTGLRIGGRDFVLVVGDASTYITLDYAESQ